LGSGVIRGVECNNLAFRTEEVDWQIWIAQGDRPYPYRYVITSRMYPEQPQYTLDIRAWKAGNEVLAVDFGFKAPAHAKKLDLEQLTDIDGNRGKTRGGTIIRFPRSDESDSFWEWCRLQIWMISRTPS
jgi:hypothetical protein